MGISEYMRIPSAVKHCNFAKTVPYVTENVPYVTEVLKNRLIFYFTPFFDSSGDVRKLYLLGGSS